jgi:hypothetical protein
MPGFEFWLETVDKPCQPGSEFCAGAEVKGGKLRGFATPFTDVNSPMDGSNPFQFSVRFEIDLTGELDCSTGTFRGKLENGCYDVLSTLFRFSGNISSSYQFSKSAFTQGSWDVKEMPLDATAAPNPDIGGSGTWDAMLAGPGSSPTAMGKGLCSGMSGLDTPLP